MSLLLLSSIGIPFASAWLCLLTAKNPSLSKAFGIAGTAAMLVTSIFLMGDVMKNGYVVIQMGNWVAPFGITLVADVLSASMVLITGIIGFAVALYSCKDIDDELVKKNYFALFHFLLMGVNGAFITGDLFNMYVWFEVMLISSFVLIALQGERDQLEGGVKYLVINLVSSMLFLCGVGLIYGKLGTLNMADLARIMTELDDPVFVTSSAMLLLSAFAIKAGLFPFFFWLPASYHTPKVAISGLFAGLLTKVGVYALIRSHTLVFGAQFDVFQGILIFLAGATMLTGVLGAAVQYDIRKILSFHIISQIGYMIMGLAIGTTVALAGALFYTLHHIIVKTNLFLISGIIRHITGTEDLKKIGGLYRWAPGLGLLFFIPAYSLGGIPPLSGFWAKFTVIKAGLDTAEYLLVFVALFVGILTLFSMTKIWAEAFWKQDDKSEQVAKDNYKGFFKLSPFHWIPCLALALITFLIGIWSGPLFDLAHQAGEQLSNPQEYINAVLVERSSYE